MRKLIHALKKKKPKAQESLFSTYADYLFRVSFRYLKNREECEEVISQSFLNIFDAIGKTDIEEEVQLKAWMKKIVINQSLMSIRKDIRFAPTLELIDEREESEITSDELLLEKDLINMVFTLPHGYRTVFSLYAIEGYKHNEIAEKLGITVGTSKSQLSKARRLLKEMINKTEMSYEAVR
ncbi:sigma-70 family RNA polymerase sigma factor [Ancylomarina sp. DW003]|nr:sigma-70 family RNA polymerase sigma factor [Ancylomarina sp. DW003]MDE5421365.1 sigma-70 family RNA polymerase sigma factor [Ancylomarina sp. DW003]